MKLTKNKCSREDLATNAAKEELTNVVDTVDLSVLELEDTNHVVGPGCDGGDGDENDETGNHAKGVKH